MFICSADTRAGCQQLVYDQATGWITDISFTFLPKRSDCISVTHILWVLRDLPVSKGHWGTKLVTIHIMQNITKLVYMYVNTYFLIFCVLARLKPVVCL